MIKLILSAAIILMTLCGRSQPSRSDSTLLPNGQLRIALQKIEQGKQCAEELKLQQQANDILYLRLSVRDSIIYSYKSKGDLLNDLLDNY